MRFFAKDFRFALRSLLRTPVVTVVIVATLSLGIGMNTALFSVVHGVLLEPLPFRDAERLVYLQARWEEDEVDQASWSGGDFEDLRSAVTSLHELSAYGVIRQNMTGAGPAMQAQVGWVSRGFFSLLGAEAEQGRLFLPDDPPGTVVLSHPLWASRFGGDPSVAGRGLRLDGHLYTVVGVLPSTFRPELPRYPSRIDIWKVPDDFWQNGDVWGAQGPRYALFRLLGRLEPGSSRDRAREELRGLSARLREKVPEYAQAGLEIEPVPLRQAVVGRVRTRLWTLLGAVGLVLLIACANVTNLLLARGRERRREITVRLALGASRSRLASLLLTESLVLACGGGLVGVSLGWAGTGWLRRLGPADLPRLDAVKMDGTVLVFALLTCLACTLLFGLAPALGASRQSLTADLRGDRVFGGTAAGRLSRMLVVGQVGLSLVLLVGSALLVASLVRLSRVEPGFDPRGLLTFSVSAPGTRYDWPEGTNRFFRALEDRIETLPGVESAGMVWPLPLSGGGWSGQYGVESADGPRRARAEYRLITPDYFRTVGIPVVEGRNFAPSDNREVVVASRALAEREWRGRSPIGRTVLANPWNVQQETPFRVVGVVEDVRGVNLREQPAETLYFDSRSWAWADWEVDFVVRTAGSPASLVGPVRSILARLDPEVPLAEVRPMAAYLDDQLAGNRFALTLVGLFAGVAGTLAVVGLYGLLSYSVSRRAREIGIRMALGAGPRSILGSIVGQGLALLAAGLLVGTVVAMAVTRFLRGYLYGVAPQDPTTFAVVIGLLGGAALMASWLPARRAVRLDPVAVLRQD